MVSNPEMPNNGEFSEYEKEVTELKSKVSKTTNQETQES
jgi:hypothetical protein